MKKLILALTILMLVTVNTYAGGTTPCNKNKSEVSGFKKSNKQGFRTECGSFSHIKAKKPNNARYHKASFKFN